MLARFITPDTIYDQGPQGLNRYSYALNNPIRYNDPTGHIAVTGSAAAIWALTALGGATAAYLSTPEGQEAADAIIGPFVRFPSNAAYIAGEVWNFLIPLEDANENTDGIPLPAKPIDATPAKPDGGPPSKQKDPKGPGRRPPAPHSKTRNDEVPSFEPRPGKPTGRDWAKYFRNKYGKENVEWSNLKQLRKQWQKNKQTIIEAWEEAHNQTWPKTSQGAPYVPHHDPALSEGGTIWDITPEDPYAHAKMHGGGKTVKPDNPFEHPFEPFQN